MKAQSTTAITQLQADLEIDRLCTEFEFAWERGRSPNVEEYIERAPSTSRAGAIRELVAQEVDLRRGAGELSLSDEYIRRFPHDGDAIARAFQLVDGTERRTELPITVSRSSECDISTAPLKEEPAPSRIGRFEVQGLLGRGGYGSVYRAHDTRLDRPVALKIPHVGRFSSEREVREFVSEARTAARLKHSGIVTVYDVCREEDRIFIVQELVDGPNLAGFSRTETLSHRQIAELMISVSEALGVAHREGIIHRDLKPGNILLDAAGKPRIADFGLAIHLSVQRRRRGERCGTAEYMSPELVRGETHRLDGRSDIWSLGVVLYELLVGSRPFSGDTRDQVYDEIQYRDAPPPRQMQPIVPAELERICLRCLSKRISDRYPTADDLVDDLRHWLKDGAHLPAERHEPAVHCHVAPRGLRSYRESDSDFFVELLPGPRDRNGLPESMRFWKEFIEEMRTDRAFPIGLIIGPSGSGKSSLINAGVIPALGSHVKTIYVESTASDTEARLTRALANHTGASVADSSLPEMFAELREGTGDPRGRKKLIVLDQFEQWLHARRDETETQLLRALRQCDGARVQCILLVRDDFWMATLQFLARLEVDLVQGENFAAVDLFDRRHAKKVLTEFGKGYGALPADPAKFTREQKQFLDGAVDELASDGQVVCVRLALFAEMVKRKPWNLATLAEVGGVDGIGITLLEEAFDRGGINPKHRLHQHAAQAVLGSLLPETGVDIRGHSRPEHELMQVSGYADRRNEFQSLLTSLDRELRLITPAERATAKDEDAEQPVRWYQLTHDFLVPAVREWLARKQRETPSGRAQLLLAERLALWQTKRETKQLPSLQETLRIWRHTSFSRLSSNEHRMMGAAFRHHLHRSGVILLGLSAVLALVLLAALRVRQRREADRVDGLVAQIPRVEFEHLSTLVDALEPSRDRWAGAVTRVAEDTNRTTHDRVRAHIALAREDQQSLPFLQQRLLAADADEHGVLRQELRRWRAELLPDLWASAADPETTPEQLLRCGAVLASYDAANSNWDSFSLRVAEALVATDPLLLTPWVEALSPVKPQLVHPSIVILESTGRVPGERLVAASILVNIGRADQQAVSDNQLAELVLNADEPEVYARLLALAATRNSLALRERMEHQLTTAVDINGNQQESILRRQANAAQALLSLGEERTSKFWDQLRGSSDPRLRTALIDRIRSATSPRELLGKLETEPDPDIRQALVLALDGFRAELLPADESRVVEMMQDIFLNDANPGMHSAAEWLLTRWGRGEAVAELKQQLAGKPRGDRGWFINSDLVTMVIIEPPGVVQVGSPNSEKGRDKIEEMQEESIDYTFAISAHEITVEQFLRFLPDFEYAASSDPKCPITKTSLYDAMKYCRWLSQRQPDFDEDDCCYGPIESIRVGTVPADDFRSRPGYRLPTEVEWEHAVRAGTVTSRFFDTGTRHLPQYAWHATNAGSGTRPVGLLRPNPLGLFDVYGNISEWCHPLPTRSEDGIGVVRGGHYRSTPRFLRSAMPIRFNLDATVSVIGFRVVTWVDPVHVKPHERKED